MQKLRAEHGLFPRQERQDQVQSTGTRILQQQFADMGLHLDAGVLADPEALARALAPRLQQASPQLVGACARRGCIFVRGRLTHMTQRKSWENTIRWKLFKGTSICQVQVILLLSTCLFCLLADGRLMSPTGFDV